MNKSPTKLARPLLILTLLALMAVTTVSIGAAPAVSVGRDSQPDMQAVKGAANSYVVLLEELPLAVYEGDIAGMPATKAQPGRRFDAQSEAAQLYDAYLRGNQNRVRQSAGVSQSAVTNTYTVALNGFSAMMSEAEADVLRRQDGVMLVMKDQWRQAMTDSSPSFLGLTGSRGAWHQGLDGEGVLVGIIDSGIWPEHLSFVDDGSYEDVPPLDESERSSCDFGNTTQNPLDAQFVCNNKLVGARQMLDAYRAAAPIQPGEYDSARDDFGHGTHAASVTSGNSGVMAHIFDIHRGRISGIAPRSQVIAYKALGQFGALSSDLAAAVDQAVADGVDVINYGSGGGAGAPGADEFALLFASNAGVLVATAAGNAGPTAASLTNPGTMPWMTTVGASTQTRFWQGTILLGEDDDDDNHEFILDGQRGHDDDGDCDDDDALDGLDRHGHGHGNRCIKGASITRGTGKLPLVDAADAGDEYCSDALDAEFISGKIVLCLRGGGVGRPQKSLNVCQPDEDGVCTAGLGTILYNSTDEENLAADEHWTPAVHIDNTPGLAIKAYIASVGDAAEAKIIGKQVGKWPSAPSMANFSSRGPNPVAPDIIKPDITAPGAQILGGWTPTPDPGTTPFGELFAALDGTSFSSPHVAGAFALLKQAQPDWSPAMARSAVMTTAYQGVVDNDRVSPADPFDMGSGHLNLGSASKKGGRHSDYLTELDDKLWQSGRRRKPKPPQGSNKGSAFQPGLVYDAGLNDYLGFLCDTFPEIFGNPAATCGGLEAAGYPTQAINLNYPSFGISSLPGSQTVTRTVTSVAKENGWRKYKAYVDAPAGYEVTVEPASFRLKRGQTATYEVTISNVSAPVGEWRFGSLTWRDQTKRYEVYSPIAVRGVLFDAPQEIDEEGASGSGSFDIAFGYTGSYSAATHGMVAAEVTSGFITQSAQDVYQFDLADVLLFRVAMPPESTEPGVDIDIYVVDPDGNLAGASESGGTNELIDIEEPMDGTWTVLVYGWLVPEGGVDYDMWTWELPVPSGGTLAVDSAPTSAEIGTTGTVNYSWSGLSGGLISDWYLGAVSHSRDSDLISLTLVNVDNR